LSPFVRLLCLAASEIRYRRCWSSRGFTAGPVISSTLGSISSSPHAGHVSAGYQISFVRTVFTWYLGGAVGTAVGLNA